MAIDPKVRESILANQTVVEEAAIKAAIPKMCCPDCGGPFTATNLRKAIDGSWSFFAECPRCGANGRCEVGPIVVKDAIITKKGKR